MMGGQSSKTKGGGDATPPLPINTDPHYEADLNAYEAACKNDPDLQSFDATIQQRTIHVLNSLANDGVQMRSLSFDALIEVTDCLLEMNQDVVRSILESREDIWKSKDMFDLVDEYFENSCRTMEFCTALENCLRRTRESQLIVQLAVKFFEEEAERGDDGKFVKTLEELGRFKAAGDPFTEEFVVLFQLVYKQHLSLFKKLQLQKRKLDKKLKSLKTWRKVSNVILVTVFASVLIFSVVAAALAAPPVVIAIAAALAVPMGPVGKWCNTLWSRYLNAVKVQRELIALTQGRTYIMLRDFENIRVLVSKFEIEIDSLLKNTNFALREEGHAVKLVIDEMEKKLVAFNETIEKLNLHAGKCSQDVIMARTVILQRIVKRPNS